MQILNFFNFCEMVAIATNMAIIFFSYFQIYLGRLSIFRENLFIRNSVHLLIKFVIN